MAMTDPIADMLTRIRNGLTARYESVDIPASKEKNGDSSNSRRRRLYKSATLLKKRRCKGRR